MSPQPTAEEPITYLQSGATLNPLEVRPTHLPKFRDSALLFLFCLLQSPRNRWRSGETALPCVYYRCKYSTLLCYPKFLRTDITACAQDALLERFDFAVLFWLLFWTSKRVTTLRLHWPAANVKLGSGFLKKAFGNDRVLA